MMLGVKEMDTSNENKITIIAVIVAIIVGVVLQIVFKLPLNREFSGVSIFRYVRWFYRLPNSIISS